MDYINNVLDIFHQDPYNIREPIYIQEYTKDAFDNPYFLQIENSDDLIIAIKSQHNRNIVCNILMNGYNINSILLRPNKIEWIFNGMPIIPSSLQCSKLSFNFYEDSERTSFECRIIPDCFTLFKVKIPTAIDIVDNHKFTKRSEFI